MSVVVVDHGLCNVGSVRRAFEECGASVLVSNDPAALAEATHVVLPGVGAFRAGMQQLSTLGWVEPLRRAVHDDGVALLGICLGMQLLADRGFEGGETKGLGLVAGEVRRMQGSATERIPHVGWNEVTTTHTSSLFEGIEPGTDFYFVHSYHFATARAEDRLAVTPYSGGITTAVEHDRVLGVQFHPEKSSKAGFRVIRNFLEI